MTQKTRNYEAFDVFLNGKYEVTTHVRIGGGEFAAKKRACELKKKLIPVMDKLEVRHIGTF